MLEHDLAMRKPSKEHEKQSRKEKEVFTEDVWEGDGVRMGT